MTHPFFGALFSRLKKHGKTIAILIPLLVVSIVFLNGGIAKADIVWTSSRNCSPMVGNTREAWRQVQALSPERNYFNILRIGCYLVELRESVRDILQNTNQILTIVRNQERNQTACTAPRTPTRQTSFRDIDQCVNACVFSSISGTENDAMLGDRLISPQRFATCISRCPSNTSNNYECARRFSDLTGDYHPEDIAGREFSQVLTGSVSRCLSDSAALQCQRECDRTLLEGNGTVGAASYRSCIDRCPGGQGIARIFSDAAQRDFNNDDLESFVKGLPAEDKDVPSAVPTNPVVTPIPPASPKTERVETKVETETTALSCADSCAMERMSCVKQAQTSKAMTICTDVEAACRTRCSQK